MVVRRYLYVAWVALALGVLAPVLPYAHIHVGANGEIIEHCAAEQLDDADAQHDHSHSGKGTVTHCLYCPGFSASATPASCGMGPVLAGNVSAPSIPPPYAVPGGRSSIRIAQQRAPPSAS
jgi:hypothetical protein